MAINKLNNKNFKFAENGTVDYLSTKSGNKNGTQSGNLGGNLGGYSYDLENDPIFASYRKSYLREADRATQDAIAQASAMTGGIPSSYAIGAAQQAGDYYRGQLQDAIPALEQNAYSRYLQAYEMQKAQEQQQWNQALALYQMGVRTSDVRAALGIPEPKKKAAPAAPRGPGRTWYEEQERVRNLLEQGGPAPVPPVKDPVAANNPVVYQWRTEYTK